MSHEEVLALVPAVSENEDVNPVKRFGQVMKARGIRKAQDESSIFDSLFSNSWRQLFEIFQRKFHSPDAEFK